MRYNKILLVFMLILTVCFISEQAFAISVQYAVGVDDFATLKIDGTLVASYDAVPAGAAYTGLLDLTPGWHDVELVYKNRYGSNFLQFGQVGIGNITLDNSRSLDADGNYTDGFRADYYDLSGAFLTTIFGEGPIEHGAMWENSQLITYYEAVYPKVWAGMFNGWSTFEERLTGQILVSDLAVNPVPEPATIFLLGGSLLGLAGFNFKRKIA